MTLQQLASIDLYALSKTQLKNYVKEAREEWGKAIDLRSAKQPELIEYLQLFLNWKVEQTQEIEEVTPPVEEAAPTFFEEIATVNNEAEDTEDYTFKVNYLKLGTYYSDGQSTYKEPSLDIAKNDTQAQYYLDGAAARNLDFEIETELVTIADPEQALVFKQSGFAQIELIASPITPPVKKEARVIRFDGDKFRIAGTQLEAHSLLQAIAQAVSCGYTPTHWQQRDSNAVLLPAECIPLDYRATYCLIRDCDAAMLSLPEETLKAITAIFR